MKKCLKNLLSIALVLLMLFSTVSVAVVGAATEDESYIMGDVNLDGNINIRDATYLQLALVKIIELDDIQQYLADMDGNLGSAITDVTYLLCYLAKKIENYAPNQDGFVLHEKVHFVDRKPVRPTKPTVDGTEITEPTKQEKPTVDGTEFTRPTKPEKPTVDGTEFTKPTKPEKPTVDATEFTKPTKPEKPTVDATEFTKPTKPTKPTRPTRPTRPTKPATEATTAIATEATEATTAITTEATE